MMFSDESFDKFSSDTFATVPLEFDHQKDITHEHRISKR